MEAAVRALFRRYEDLTNRLLAGEAVAEADLAPLYAAEVIGAGPGGVRAAHNDRAFLQGLIASHAQARAIGARAMHLRALRLLPIDADHGLVHVEWAGRYARAGADELSLDFSVHYLLRWQGRAAQVFGWIAGDEQALLKAHGLI